MERSEDKDLAESSVRIPGHTNAARLSLWHKDVPNTQNKKRVALSHHRWALGTCIP